MKKQNRDSMEVHYDSRGINCNLHGPYSGLACGPCLSLETADKLYSSLWNMLAKDGLADPFICRNGGHITASRFDWRCFISAWLGTAPGGAMLVPTLCRQLVQLQDIKAGFNLKNVCVECRTQFILIRGEI